MKNMKGMLVGLTANILLLSKAFKKQSIHLKVLLDNDNTGVIHLAQGVYDIYSPIQLYPFITLSGEGKIDYDVN